MGERRRLSSSSRGGLARRQPGAPAAGSAAARGSGGSSTWCRPCRSAAGRPCVPPQPTHKRQPAGCQAQRGGAHLLGAKVVARVGRRPGRAEVPGRVGDGGGEEAQQQQPGAAAAAALGAAHAAVAGGVAGHSPLLAPAAAALHPWPHPSTATPAPPPPAALPALPSWPPTCYIFQLASSLSCHCTRKPGYGWAGRQGCWWAALTVRAVTPACGHGARLGSKPPVPAFAAHAACSASTPAAPRLPQSTWPCRVKGATRASAGRPSGQCGTKEARTAGTGTGRRAAGKGGQGADVRG